MRVSRAALAAIVLSVGVLAGCSTPGGGALDLSGAAPARALAQAADTDPAPSAGPTHTPGVPGLPTASEAPAAPGSPGTAGSPGSPGSPESSGSGGGSAEGGGADARGRGGADSAWAAPGAAGPTPGAACGGRVTSVADVERLVAEPVGCPGSVNTFWHGELGNAWTPPRIIPYHNGQIPNDACGREVGDPDQFADNALYCTLDDTVAYSVEFLDELARLGGASYPLFVLMHELSHRGDRIGGALGAVSRAEENQADCFAGRQAAAADKAGRIDLSDAINGSLLFFSLGDTRGGWFNQEPSTAPDAHGTPMQRAQAFGLGYLRDSATCHRIGRSPTGQVSA